MSSFDKRPGPCAARLYPRVYQLFKQWQPTIVHTRNLAALEAVVPAWAAGVPVRIHGEHGWSARSGWQEAAVSVVRRLYRPFVHRYVALSPDHSADYLDQRIGVPPHRVAQIYNGVDTERFRLATQQRCLFPAAPSRAPMTGAWAGSAAWMRSKIRSASRALSCVRASCRRRWRIACGS